VCTLAGLGAPLHTRGVLAALALALSSGLATVGLWMCDHLHIFRTALGALGGHCLLGRMAVV
jgi:hypothetical protein